MDSGRYSTIEETNQKNRAKLQNLLSHIDFSKSGGPTNVYQNPYLNTPMCVETDKFFMLFSSKNASSIIQKVFCETEYNVFDEDISFGDGRIYSEFGNMLMFNDKKVKYDILSELKLILDGKSKKDLIIMTRNPMYKFLSGLVMELTTEFQNSDILSYKVFGHSKQNIHNGFGFNDKIKNIEVSILAELLDDYFSNRFMNRTMPPQNHFTLYNETYSHILSNYNVDTSKVKIFDIDNPESNMGSLFGSYYPELANHEKLNNFWTQRELHSVLLDALSEMRDSPTGSMAWERIQSDIYSDYFYYQLLYQKFPKNIFVNNDLDSQ